MRERAETALDDPQARLERALIDEYLEANGCTRSTVAQGPPDEGRRLMARAATYAAGRLAEIDARAAYIHRIHGGLDRQ